MGEHTHEIDSVLYTENRSRLVARLAADPKTPKGSVIVLEGGKQKNLYDTDVELLFRQESYFAWAFGVREPGYYGAIDVQTGKSILFAPYHDKETYTTWSGKLNTTEEIRDIYKVDEVHYVEDIVKVLQGMKAACLLTLYGPNSDSRQMTVPAQFDGIEKFQVNKEVLHTHFAECRVTKSDREIEIIRYSNQISSAAHVEVMRNVRVGMKEYQLESMFLHYCYFNGGARYTAYTCICGSGENSGVLHYGHAAAANTKTLTENDMCLLDMGCEYSCYASDITCSYPASGKFNEQQRFVYETVLKSNRAVLAAAKPGVTWSDLHLLSLRVILEQMIDYGLLSGDIEQMMKIGLGTIFMPHGLGHLLGIDVHDVGGYLPNCPSREGKTNLECLRTCRTLLEGMVLTIEPGLYFIETKLEKAKKEPFNSFINWDLLDKFRTFGGVRIEDNVVIRKDSAELLTDVPRTVQEIEECMAQGRKNHVEFPQLRMQK